MASQIVPEDTPEEKVFYDKVARKDWHIKAFKNPKEIAEAIRDGAIKKAHVHPLRLIVLGILAGMYVGFGGMFAIAVAGGLGPEFAHEHPGIQKALVGLTFPVALPLILLAGGELYTGNTMFVTMGLLTRKITFAQAAKILGCSFLTNFIGTHFIAGMIVTIGGYFKTSPYHDFLSYLWTAKAVSPDWGQIFVRAIPANMLVCLAVMIAYAAEDIGGKMIGMYPPVMAFAAVGMEHVIANMFFLPTAVFTGAASDYGFWLWKNLIPATLGNTLGGAFLAFCYWFAYLTEDHPVKAETSRWHIPHWMHFGRHHRSAAVALHAGGGATLHVPMHEMHDLHQVVIDGKDSSSRSTSDSSSDAKKRLTHQDADHHHAKPKRASHHGKHK